MSSRGEKSEFKNQLDRRRGDSSDRTSRRKDEASSRTSTHRSSRRSNDNSPVRSQRDHRRSPNRKNDHHDRKRSRSTSRSRVRASRSPERKSRHQSINQPQANTLQRDRDTQSINQPAAARAANPLRRPDDVQLPWGNDTTHKDQEVEPKEEEKKDKPNFGLSGKLLEDTNLVNGVVISYAQPAEARVPKVRWRLYPFKGDEALPTMYIHRQSAYLLGRDRRVVDIPLDHPSCSKQHAVIQFRLIPVEKEDGTVVRRVKPYIIDLNSGNGTMVNGKKVEPQRYLELLEKDVVKFGFSSREYVMLHEGSKDDEYQSDGEE